MPANKAYHTEEPRSQSFNLYIRAICACKRAKIVRAQDQELLFFFGALNALFAALFHVND